MEREIKKNRLSSAMNQTGLILSLGAILSIAFQIDAGDHTPDFGLSAPFYSPSLNVQWAVPTNQMPSAAIVFKIVPDADPGSTLSNLMKLGRFRSTDSTRGFDPNKISKTGIYTFMASDDGRTLNYAPSHGRIVYSDEKVFHGPGSKVEGVPDEASAFALALRYVSQFGITTNDMVKNQAGDLQCVFPTGSWGHTDEDTKIHRRGVGFTRSLDGTDVTDYRAFFMEYGNDAKLGAIDVNWPVLRPEGSYPVASPTQILKWIKEGRAAALSLSGPVGARYVRVADIRKLTIIKFHRFYPYIDKDNPSHHIYPYALLTATAELGNEDEEQVILFAPLISEGLPAKRQPANSGFSIYPSKRMRRTEQ
jgi:hypothetical protein